jgi:DNA-3-methyladenine glycosylase I
VSEVSQSGRCPWCGTDPLYVRYHDEEWGVPVHDDQMLFEFLTLETFQAGLSWITVLRKRENFRMAFAGFDVGRVAAFSEHDVERLMTDAGIIRNGAKIRAAISNAQAFMAVQKEFGTFDRYIWGFVDGRPINNQHRELRDLPARTELSDRISADLKKRGFKFVGSTVVYAHMQATGMVNDHLIGCPRHAQVQMA